jgi:hypothetical protein
VQINNDLGKIICVHLLVFLHDLREIFLGGDPDRVGVTLTGWGDPDRVDQLASGNRNVVLFLQEMAQHKKPTGKDKREIDH